VLALGFIFHALPREIDLSIMPIFSGVALILAGTFSLIYKPTDLADVAVRSTVLGGVLGAGFWLAGLCHVAST